MAQPPALRGTKATEDIRKLNHFAQVVSQALCPGPEAHLSEDDMMTLWHQRAFGSAQKQEGDGDEMRYVFYV